jgi:hypothetical protein
MNPCVKQLKDKQVQFDGIIWTKNEEGESEVTGIKYNDPGIAINTTQMGEMYDIIVMGDNDVFPDRFQGILTSPFHYVSRMLDDGFTGAVYKMTTTSKDYVDDIYDTCIKQFNELLEKNKWKNTN